jgi:hypothetical protein
MEVHSCGEATVFTILLLQAFLGMEEVVSSIPISATKPRQV